MGVNRDESRDGIVAKRGPEVESKPEEPSKKDDIRKEKLYYSRDLSSHTVVVVRAVVWAVFCNAWCFVKVL